MNHKQTLMILGSGLMVFSLATATAFFVFSPASSSAGVVSLAQASNSYDDFNPEPNPLKTETVVSTEESAQTVPMTRGQSFSRLPQVSGLSSQRRFGASVLPGSNLPDSITNASNDIRQNSTLPGSNESMGTGINGTNNFGRTAKNIDGVQIEQLLPNSTRPAGSIAAGNLPASQMDIPLLGGQPIIPTPYEVTPGTTERIKSAPKTAPKSETIKKATKNSPVQKTSAKPVAKPAENRIVKPGYWIQLASYSSLNRAKNAQEDLKRLGLSTSIEVTNLGSGKLVYRVKAGAWTNEQEAKSFLQSFTTSHNVFNDAFVVSANQ